MPSYVTDMLVRRDWTEGRSVDRTHAGTLLWTAEHRVEERHHP